MISVNVAVVQCGSRAGGSPRIAILSVPPDFWARTSAGATRMVAKSIAATNAATLRDAEPNREVMGVLPSCRYAGASRTRGECPLLPRPDQCVKAAYACWLG